MKGRQTVRVGVSALVVAGLSVAPAVRRAPRALVGCTRAGCPPPVPCKSRVGRCVVFPRSCLFGKSVGGFHDEHWLNINAATLGINPTTGRKETPRQFLLDELSARLAGARQLRVDAIGIEFDNVDAYQNDTGFSMSATTQLLFDVALANLTHRQGFRVALKNDVGQTLAWSTRSPGAGDGMPARRAPCRATS